MVWGHARNKDNGKVDFCARFEERFECQKKAEVDILLKQTIRTLAYSLDSLVDKAATWNVYILFLFLWLSTPFLTGPVSFFLLLSFYSQIYVVMYKKCKIKLLNPHIILLSMDFFFIISQISHLLQQNLDTNWYYIQVQVSCIGNVTQLYKAILFRYILKKCCEVP